ncbi:F-box domain-containing protein [Colletotrichum musicola]|uniref:F-box domain-containing protein n=1 Tax=Colletotrichum musicola TaxID=2175873 RepID=A0A8H6NDP2_9PEZI|nr:F-box domain-containing protein [Colletotrichum musicola]
MFQLTDLPDTLFLEILTRLTPREIVLHRLVSRASHTALTRHDLSQALLHVFFPRSLECRFLRSQTSSGNASTPPDSEPPDWPAIFASVSRRYHNLSSGTFHSITTINLLKDRKLLRPFAPWNRLLRRDGMSAPLQQHDANWTYDDGVLVYPSPGTTPVLKALDLCSGSGVAVPFDLISKIIRRLRLSHGVLVIEWAEEEASHPLNERDVAHRHFATAFNIHTTSSPLLPGQGSAPEVSFRAEWKIHYLGLPLSSHDRLLSAHSATHYAAYAHQPTRSPWGEDLPLERLVTWALGAPSNFRPSLDPTSSRPADDPGPEVILRLANSDLDHWAIRQHDTPRIMKLALDEGHVFLQEEDHLWAAGPQSSSSSPPARHVVRSTGIPISGTGPRWVDECGAEGDAERSFCPATLHDSDDGKSWPGRAPCWRHEEFPYLTVSEVVDHAAGTRVCGRRCFAMETVSASTALNVPDAPDRAGSDDEDGNADAWAGRGEVQFGDDVWRTVMSGAALAGDERWVIGEDAAGDVSVVRF